MLVLWDIDHTLIDSGQASGRAYAAAFQAATGRSLASPWRFDGRTELAAVTEALQEHGLPADGQLRQAFLDAIVAELRSRAGDLAATGRVLPGVAEALHAVAHVLGAHQSVLTGNLFAVAQLKLATFGLADRVDLRIGAFGGDAYERTDLPGHAFARALRHLGRSYRGAEAVIIGDTVRDVAAAHAVGAKAIAVATGATSAERLGQAGADAVFTDLSDTEALLAAIVS